MHRYHVVHSVMLALFVTLFSYALSHLADIQGQASKFSAQFQDNRPLATTLVFTVMFFLIRWSDKLSEFIVENIPGLSWAIRRVLSGSDFIEGDWPLVVVDMGRGQLKYLGFLTITHKNGQPFVYGDDWTPDGAHALSYKSIQAEFQEHVLRYWYKQKSSLQQPDMEGFTRMYFFPEQGLPHRHAGKFLDAEHLEDIRFYAVRRRYRWFEARIASREEKLQEARKLWEQIYKNLSRLRAAKISADFA